MVWDVVKDKNHSKNVTIFGLEEENYEELNFKVSELFQSVEEKPRVDACRVGRRKSGETVRPLKVKTVFLTVADQILLKSGKLRSVDQYKNVSVNTDRSLEQR